MASRALGAESALVTLPHVQPYVAFFPEPGTRQDRFLIQGYVDRDEIAAAAQALIDLLDTIDGDPDSELNGDEADHSHSEECFVAFNNYASGPGCPISDAGGHEL